MTLRLVNEKLLMQERTGDADALFLAS